MAVFISGLWVQSFISGLWVQSFISGLLVQSFMSGLWVQSFISDLWVKSFIFGLLVQSFTSGLCSSLVSVFFFYDQVVPLSLQAKTNQPPTLTILTPSHTLSVHLSLYDHLPPL